MKNIREALKIEFNEIYPGSDSTIVLACIAGDPSRQKHLYQIEAQKFNHFFQSKHWHHVKSGENPADLVSRGLANLKDLRQRRLWLEGPNWLSKISDRLQNEIQLKNLSQQEIEILKSEQKSEIQVFFNNDNSNRP